MFQTIVLSKTLNKLDSKLLHYVCVCVCVRARARAHVCVSQSITEISICNSKTSNREIVVSYSTFREKAMAPHSSTLAWKIPWMEESGRLQPMGLLRVGHD